VKRLPLWGERPSPLAEQEVQARVLVTVAGAADDTSALRFGALLAEAMGVGLWHAGAGLPALGGGEHAAVAVGAELACRLTARLRVVLTDGLPRAAWRDRRLQADLELAEVRPEVARRLAEVLRAAHAGGTETLEPEPEPC